MKNKMFKYLIADTTAFINSVPLQDYADFVLTVPDVVNEVKNKRQIRRLVVLPFDLEVREPNSDCLKYVTEFAKKTGDFASLSVIDLKVIALTYELERHHCGIDHLRTEPVVKRVIASKNKPEELIEETSMTGFYLPNKGTATATETANLDANLHDNAENLISALEEIKIDQKITDYQDTNSIIKKGNSLYYTENNFDKLNFESKSSTEYDFKNKIEEKNNHDITENINSTQIISDEIDNFANEILIPQIDEPLEQETCESSGSDEEGSEDESSWITPSNIKNVKAQFQGETEAQDKVIVACMSTDYAIQNVLKQINLNIAAINGRVIKHLRTYILRCYACFKTTSIMTKVFCPHCGNRTLKRVAVSLDENGHQVIHINLRRPLTRKFKNQSLPRPKGGKHSQNPILVEDQPIPKQMPSRVAKTKTNALDEDYIAGYSPFVVRDVDSKSALLRTKGNIKLLARNNMYEENRRKKHSSRLLK